MSVSRCFGRCLYSLTYNVLIFITSQQASHTVAFGYPNIKTN